MFSGYRDNRHNLVSDEREARQARAQPDYERERPSELNDSSKDSEELSGMKVSGRREEDRRAVDARTVEQSEELSGPVIREDPGEHDSHNHKSNIGRRV